MTDDKIVMVYSCGLDGFQWIDSLTYVTHNPMGLLQRNQKEKNPPVYGNRRVKLILDAHDLSKVVSSL